MSGTTDILCGAFFYKSNIKLVLTFPTPIPNGYQHNNWKVFFFNFQFYIHIASSAVSYTKQMINVQILNRLTESPRWHCVKKSCQTSTPTICHSLLGLKPFNGSPLPTLIKSKHLLVIQLLPTFLASSLINTFASIRGIQ